MPFTSEQALALAPDSASASSGRKLANTRHWKSLGRNADALWGECQGSGKDPYKVEVDLATLSVKCSCPSRKFPCKHGLGLMLIFAAKASDVAEAEPPQWVADWLAKRHTRAEKHTAEETLSPEANAAKEQAREKGKARRAEKREKLVADGVAGLNLWLEDLMRNGLAAVETQPESFWEIQAARMTDAQAPGIAGRLRTMATLPGSAPDWPDRLISDLGRVTLLTRAYAQLDALDPALREDVRHLVGWSYNTVDLETQGERISDDWAFLGQWVEDQDRGQVQYTWLRGRSTGRTALIAQFALPGKPFAELLMPGVSQRAELGFWPGASPHRASLLTRQGDVHSLTGPLPGAAAIEPFLESVAESLARQPWQERFLAVLSQVTPHYDANANIWRVRDANGAALPLTAGEHWLLMAISGGRPIDVAGEWDGRQARPLGALSDGVYHPLGESD
ncbi:MAG TPA: SWIM zinc finger family protein [Ktedonobacterales bacterium]|nr:SWIM zinc finger family protein [Ktedonobacterales bacterium]